MTIESLISVLATGGQHVGDLVWWSLADAQIDRATLEAKWLPSGLAKELLPETPTVEKAFKCAVKETQVGLESKLIRLARSDEHGVVFGIVREEKRDDGTLFYTQEARVAVDHISGTFTTDNAAHEVVTAIKSRYENHRDKHTADDVRRMINRTLQSFSSVLLRENGGVWWTPSPYAKQVRALQATIESIGASRFYLLPIHDSSDANRALGDVAAKSLEEELDSLKQEVEKFLSNPPDRPSTLVRRFDAFEALRSRADLYRTILNVQVKDLDSTLTQLSESVEKLLAEKAA